MTPTERVLSVLEGTKRAGSNWQAKCPAHEDREPSLSVREGRDGAVLIKCHAGCDTETVVARMGLTMADLFPAKTDTRSEIVDTYDYRNAEGELVYQVVRYSPKTFRQRRPGGPGAEKWVWNLRGVDRVLYRLPDVLLERDTVYVVEGEKDADALAARGRTATCNVGGAGKWRDDYSKALRHVSRVVVVADRDAPGRAHARAVVESLRAHGIEAEAVQPPDGCKDVSDMLAAGLTSDAFERLPADDPVEELEADPVPADLFLDWDAFWSKDHSEPEWLYEPILARGRGHATYGPAGTKKSLLALYISAQLATGPDPVAVVYLDYEMTEDDLYERLEDMGYGPDTDLTRFHYALLPNLPPLDTKEGGEAIDQILNQVEATHPGHHVYVVIDTTGRAVEGEENAADTLRRFYRLTGTVLKRHRATWNRLDHTGKDVSKGQRGTKAKDDDPDIVWELRETENGVRLTAKKRRMGWAPDRVVVALADNPLRFIPVPGDWPKGTQETADLLDQLAVPLDASTRTAQAALKEAGEGKRRELILAALKWRNQDGNHPRNHLTLNLPEPPPEPPGENPTNTRPEPPPEPPGTTSRDIPGPGSPVLQGTGPESDQICPECTIGSGRHSTVCRFREPDPEEIAR